MSVPMTTLADYLKKKRIQSGLTQMEVAERLRYLTPQFISNWERGESMPPLAALTRLVKIYNLDIDTLVEILVEQTRAELVQSLYSSEKYSGKYSGKSR